MIDAVFPDGLWTEATEGETGGVTLSLAPRKEQPEVTNKTAITQMNSGLSI